MAESGAPSCAADGGNLRAACAALEHRHDARFQGRVGQRVRLHVGWASPDDIQRLSVRELMAEMEAWVEANGRGGGSAAYASSPPIPS